MLDGDGGEVLLGDEVLLDHLAISLRMWTIVPFDINDGYGCNHMKSMSFKIFY
jgi:hypothetical protein